MLNRFSVFNSSMEQNRLQGWLTVANAVETGELALSGIEPCIIVVVS